MNPKMQKHMLLLILPMLFLANCSQTKPTSLPATIPVVVSPNAIPLEGSVYLSVEELNGHIKLKLRTEKIYSVYNNEIRTMLDTTTGRTIKITINGIVTCAMRQIECLETEGPARNEIDLGIISGEYDLTFQYTHQTQAYSFMVSVTDIVFVPKDQSSFVEPKYLEWKRLPEHSMWFVLHNEGVHMGGGNWQPLERAVYEQLSAKFLRDIEQFDVEQFHPAEGHYTNYLFVPPWESWHEIVGDRVKIPLEGEGWYEFRWPYIRYYTYVGDWRSIQELAETYRKQGLGISFFNVSGYPYAP